jgi:hypothetical protein
MRLWQGAVASLIAGLVLVVGLVTPGCSEPPPAEKKAPEPPPAPLSGRQAFQYTMGMARAWGGDAQVIEIRSLNLQNPKSGDGKAGAWQIIYVSPSRGKSKTFTWSAIEAGGSLHKGVFGNQEEAWSPRPQQRPFYPAAVKIDTPEALQTAIAKSDEYLKRPGTKPQINFLLDASTRFPNAAWRVFWGESVSGAEWSIFVDASTGDYLGR